MKRADLEAMEAFASRIPEMQKHELKAAFHWIAEYSWAHLKERERWPWWNVPQQAAKARK